MPHITEYHETAPTSPSRRIARIDAWSKVTWIESRSGLIRPVPFTWCDSAL